MVKPYCVVVHLGCNTICGLHYDQNAFYQIKSFNEKGKNLRVAIMLMHPSVPPSDAYFPSQDGTEYSSYPQEKRKML
jgi:hypothetical protein